MSSTFYLVLEIIIFLSMEFYIMYIMITQIYSLASIIVPGMNINYKKRERGEKK